MPDGAAEVLRPRDAADVAEAVAQAAAAGDALELLGGGSKREYGRPPRGRPLALAALSGVLEYEPAELVLTALAGTPLGEVEALLDARRQMLAFEPVAWRGLFGPAAPAPTLGGTLACNCAGPRRVRAGAARDHFLGFAAVNGWGDAYKAGAKVVKNVTGYDLCKLHAGALGTLSVLTEVTVKVLPRPELERTLLVCVPEPELAVRLMAAALNSPHEVSAAAYVPAGPAMAATGADGPAVALRIEGHAPSVAMRSAAVAALAAGMADRLAWLDAAPSAELWRAVGEVEALGAAPTALVWRLSVAPSDAPAVMAAIRALVPGAAFLLDWGGALLWTALPEGSGPVRAALRGGHATLVRAPAAMRAVVPVFQPEPGPVAALSRRVKAQFDPGGVLNPGRMHAEG